jgi:hypothetical protein
MVLRVTSVIALFVLGFFMLGTSIQAAPASSPGNTVLILGSTVTGGMSSKEALAVPPGFVIEIASAADWAAKTTADFKTYRAIILGDPTCPAPGLGPVQPAIDNAMIWANAVDDKVLIVGTDPTFHSPYQPGAAQLIVNSIAHVVQSTPPGKTSALIDLSCYYNNAGLNNIVHLLDGFGTFIVRDNPCFANVHIATPLHPSMNSLSDASLSNWDCSMHALFTTWPLDFKVIAMSSGTTSDYLSEDGVLGTPYILARDIGGPVDTDCEVLPSITFGGVTPDTLWEPNKKMIDITVLAPQVVGEDVTVTRTITCSETPKQPWTIFYEDGVDIWHFKLRADRNGAASPTNHSPRIYTITYEGTDRCGNVTSTSTQVIVSHDQKSKKK